MPWLLAADPRSAIGRLLDVVEDDVELPVVASVAAAIESFATSILRRRRFVTGVAQTRRGG